MNHTGKLVLVERFDEKGNAEYHSGEWFCIRDTGLSLHCVKPTAGYEITRYQVFCVEGTHPWKVVAVRDGQATIERLVQELPAFIAERHSPKPNWILSVYSAAEQVLYQLKELLPVGRARLTPEAALQQIKEIINSL